MNHRNMAWNSNDKEMLLNGIGLFSFAMVDMGLYLDTHPQDREALHLFRQYAGNKASLQKEYAMKYGPLTLEDAKDCKSDYWSWAMMEMPWELCD